MLLRYAVQNMLRKGRNTLFIKCQNVLRALASLNSINKYLNRLYQVQKAINYSSPLAMRRQLSAAIMLSFVQYLALLSQFRVSYINRIRQQFLIKIAFRAQQSTQKRSPPLGFLTKITREATGEALARINPLERLSLRYLRSTLSLFQDMLYRGLNLYCLPSLSLIL